MPDTVRRVIRTAINGLLAPARIKIVGADSHDWSDSANFIPFEQTMAEARAAGLSIGDYVDSVMNGVPGSSQHTIDEMAAFGVFSNPIDAVVEIGPGTGRYLEKTLKAARPARYEVYETATSWAAYLTTVYNVTLRKTDGYSLAETADLSVDLVQAHKVFSGVSFMVTCCYWHEMVRVIRPGGWAVFDILTERCLERGELGIWATSGIRQGPYPAVMPRELALRFFASHGFDLVGSALVPLPPGTTELMAFRRNSILN